MPSTAGAGIGAGAFQGGPAYCQAACVDPGRVVPSGFMCNMGYFGTWVFVAVSVASRGGVAPEQAGRALAERAAVTRGGSRAWVIDHPRCL